MSKEPVFVNPMEFVNNTSLRLISAVGTVTGINDCSGSSRSSWQVVFNYKDPGGVVKKDGELIFQDIEPITNPPYSISLSSLSAQGEAKSPIFCARWGSYAYFKVKVYVKMSDGTESNCIFFNLQRPAGANREAARSQVSSGKLN
jgi:hypothetical protein